MTRHEALALHGALCVVWGDYCRASAWFDAAWLAISGGADFPDPYDYARTREAYSEAVRRCWGAYMEQRRIAA
jgi:hypothetical protein